MAVYQLTKWAARDGKEFETEREAIAHDRHVAIVEALRISFPNMLNAGTMHFIADKGHVLHALLANYFTVDEPAAPPASEAWVCMNCGCKMSVDRGSEKGDSSVAFTPDAKCTCEDGHTAAARDCPLHGWGGANVAERPEKEIEYTMGPYPRRKRDLAGFLERTAAKDVDENGR